jgi:hypothetical protein
LALSSVSPSTPLVAGRRFSTRDTYGIDERRTLIARGAIPAQPEVGTLGRDRAAASQSRIGETDGGTQPDLAGHGVEREMPVIRTGIGEVVDESPVLRLRVRVVAHADLEDRRDVARHDGASSCQVHTAGDALRHPEVIDVDELGVDGLDRSADGERNEPRDRRRCAVRGDIGIRLGHSRPDPAGTLAVNDVCLVRTGHMDDDVAVAIEPARLVVIEFAGHPLVTVPGLPGERRTIRIHPDTLDVAL